ncbi:EF-hand calcium-binding domain-containing protein 12-like isoform X2 [Stegostoma tigrinum]|uniref:EF-hand calcium-binding domain-containing protein 12-like isoform X2 n=1 Tax=Stegostoma tigrinum TaxID=3053191 RepID=UPI00287014B4|nr:EF-hand calcium-binding domain-containing protein 12-like isoform X2 [Stegostoma tigrinum]
MASGAGEGSLSVQEDVPVTEGEADRSVTEAAPVPLTEWAACRRRRRAMLQTHFFKMACKMFGSPRCKLRVSTAVRAPEQLTARLRVVHSQTDEKGVQEEEDGEERQSLQAKGWSAADYTKWLSGRKRQRTELQIMANVRRWINSKTSANDLELRVLETLERQQRGHQHGYSPGLSEPNPPEELFQESWDQEQLRSEDVLSSSKMEQQENLSKVDFMQFDKNEVHHMDLMEKCLLVRGEKHTIACHSLPTTITGVMGETNNVYQEHCHKEYKKILKMCQYYGIPFTERMLEKALLHPGDKLKMEPDLKLRAPGTGLLPNREVQKWVSTRRLIALNQLNRQLAGHKGVIQRESKLENILKDVSQEKNLRKLKLKAQPMSGQSPSARANPYAFWPGHLLDKVRMYLPYAMLEHKEVFFNNVQEDSRLSPYGYYSNQSWPISEQGYLTYGDINMHKRYWL